MSKLNSNDFLKIVECIIEGLDKETTDKIAKNLAFKFKDNSFVLRGLDTKRKEFSDSQVSITTAQKLSEKEKTILKDKIRAQFSGQSLKFHFDVQEEIVGGMIIRKGEEVIDNSLKNRINQIQKNIESVEI